MVGAIRKSRIKTVPLSAIKDDLSRFLREVGKKDIVITGHGKPAGERGCEPWRYRRSSSHRRGFAHRGARNGSSRGPSRQSRRSRWRYSLTRDTRKIRLLTAPEPYR